MKDILVSYGQNLSEQKINFLDSLTEQLANAGYNIITSDSIKDILATLNHNARIVCFIYDWENSSICDIAPLVEINPDLPVFAIYSNHTELDLGINDFKLNLDFLQYDLHMIGEDVHRIENSINSYIDAIMPSFTKTLMQYVDENKYTFCTPGHMGGTAFTKSPVGALFYDFFGENVFKADISISVPELGSLLDHSGKHKEAEEFIADAFNADHSYIVTNGTSTANKIIGMFAAGDGDTILVDRNCHKSICHFMMMTNVTPIYLKPTRNAYGILGGIPKSEFTKEAINAKIAASPVPATWPSYAVVTNSTYDGLLYNVEYIKQNLTVEKLHFDSAWIPYTNFHPIYRGLYGMSSGAKDGQVVFETHSTHKLLAAFSQASMIHVKGKFDKEVMNECFMLHTSTSPLYQITASCEIAAAMMKGYRGQNLINGAIKRATNFRREIKKLNTEAKTWFFDVWQPEHIDEAKCWELGATEQWHGFKNQDAQHIYLDPVKVTVLMPGIKNGQLDSFGIPASLVSMYLDDHGIIVEKTGPYSMLFLFSIGINRPKSMKLLTVLNQFKADFDANLLVKDMLPNLYAQDTAFYKIMRIQDLAAKLHGVFCQYDLPKIMYQAFDCLPTVKMTPHQAYQKLIHNQTKSVKLANLAGEVAAVMVLPYPPGVPLIMPGEMINAESMPVLNYLLMLEAIGKEIPGFATDIHGVEKDADGDLIIKVIKS